MTPVTHPEHNRAPSILRAQRRGSALLIVVGTLAIIAVFAAIYIAIGQGDQRVARSIESRNATTDSTETIANYLADVIAIDRSALVTKRASLNEGTIFAQRETTDAPYTDYTMRTETNLLWERFNPEGTQDPTQTDSLPNAINDYRVASDPWLASTSPTYLGDPGQPMLGPANDDRPFGKLLTNANDYAAGPYASSFLDNRDWAQISNFGPDGRPVNLFNLRPNQPPNGFPQVNTLGSFNAEPGTGQVNRNGRQIRRMSEYLSLWKPASDDPLTVIKAFDPQAEGIWLQGRNTPDATHGIMGDLTNVPAVWTMNQRFAFLPLNQPFVTYNRLDNVSSWADPDYPAYQWADADGDGMADSRWFELVAARDTQSGSSSERTDIERFYDAGRARVFFAARAIDLTSLVNVNTATDQIAIPEPTMGAPLGATPADIDLRRLLTMQDAAENYSTNRQIGLSPKFFHRPPSTRRNDLLDTDYFNYEARYENISDIGPTSPNRVDTESAANTLSVGRYAYNAIKRSIVESRVLDERYFGIPPETRRPNPASAVVTPMVNDFDTLFNSPQTLAEIQEAYGGMLDPATNPQILAQTFLGTDTAVERRDYYNDLILPNNPTENVSLYANDDLAELLTFHGLNDPNTLSRLEKAALGRLPSMFDVNQRSYTPLLSNRPLELDRTRHGLTEVPPRYAIETLDTFQNRDVTGTLSKESMALFTLSPRRLLTTLSGSVPLTPGNTINYTGNTLEAQESALTNAEAAPSISSVINNAQTAFNVYSGALASELDSARFPSALTMDQLFVTDLSTRRSNATAAPYATLFYGHRGPELALRIAAHSAVNMKDLADGDTTPTVATLIVDNDQRDSFEDTSIFPTTDTDSDPADPFYRDYPGRALGNFFDPGETNLPGNTGSPHLPTPKRRAINVYGVEAMPIITEFATIAIFHDASENGAGGDPDYGPQRPRVRGVLPPVIPLAGTQTKITINPARDSVNNPDCLAEIVAFQIHNPFDTSISLGGNTIAVSDNAQASGVALASGDALTRHRLDADTNQVDTNANYQFDYYIEWNGYFFKLAEFTQYYPPSSNTLEPDPRDSDINITGVNNPAVDYPANVAMDPMNGGALVDVTSTLNDPIYPDFMARNVVLDPGETRTFYAVVWNGAVSGSTQRELKWQLDEKWVAALNAYGELPNEFVDMAFDFDNDSFPDGLDGRGWTGPARDWIESQLTSAGSRPVLVHPMNPQTGEYLDTTAVYDYLDAGPAPHGSFSQLNAATGRTNDTEARLWRKIVTPGEETRDSTYASATNENLLHNDMLVDRLEITDPYPPAMILDPSMELPKTASFAENYPNNANEITANVRNDNTGYTVIRWSSTSRADSQDAMIPGIGQVREWMLSSRTNPTNLKIDVLDRTVEFGGDTALLDNGDFINSSADLDDASEPVGTITAGDTPARLDYEVHRHLGDLYNLTQSVVSTIGFDPYQKSELGANVADNGSTLSVIDKFNRDPAAPAPAGSGITHPSGIIASLHGVSPASRDVDLRPEVITNAASFNNAPRLADLLLTLGIGPAFAPDNSLIDNSASYYPDEWMTLPEALAIALGYENPAAATDAVESVWSDTFIIGDEALVEGRLAIDNYVAYLNANTSENPPEFTYDEDIRRGTGAPMALAVIDAVRPFDVATNQDPLTTPVPGTININTAPVEVLRLLPGLSPSTSAYYNTTGTGTETEWWGDDDPNYQLPDLTRPYVASADPRLTPDVAALMKGYRDRTRVYPRAHATIWANSPADYDVSPVNYAPSAGVNGTTNNTAAFATNLVNEIPQIFNGDTDGHRDRQSMSGIDALRETPGFGSLGEILAVTLDENANGFTSTFGSHTDRVPNLDIQQYSYDELNLDGIVDPTAVVLDPQVFGGTQTGITVDDQAERLAIANGILNTITVRSDYFAVWFVMHVYQPGDVENLQPQDPLIPSVAKRFLMVIDRSNVTRPGDSPRIVLFREVPM